MPDAEVAREGPVALSPVGLCARKDSSALGVQRQWYCGLSVDWRPSVRITRNRLHVKATTAIKPRRFGERSFLFARNIHPTTKLITSGSPERNKVQPLMDRWENVPVITPPATIRINPK